MDILLKENNHWAHFDTEKFPFVKVTMKNSIKNDEDFENFLNSWEELYEKQRYFTLYFDTTDVGFVSMKYAIKMSSFIKRLKSDYPRLLQRSFIKVRSSWVKFLLRTIFFLVGEFLGESAMRLSKIHW